MNWQDYNSKKYIRIHGKVRKILGWRHYSCCLACNKLNYLNYVLSGHSGIAEKILSYLIAVYRRRMYFRLKKFICYRCISVYCCLATVLIG